MELEHGDKQSTLIGDFGSLSPIIHAALEGRKTWKSPQRLVFETSTHNLRVLNMYFPGLFEDTSPLAFAPVDSKAFPFRLDPRDYQLACFHKFKDRPVWAIFSDPGTGKTKTALDMLSYNFLADRIDLVIVLSYPKGVHIQWVEDQMPEHIWMDVDIKAFAWDGKGLPPWMLKKIPQKKMFSGNIEMLVHERSRAALYAMAGLHRGRWAFIIDESDAIKNFGSVRNKMARRLANDYDAKIRGIMTGTPLAKDLTDEWAQFYFMDPNIIGHKYKTSFRAEFCKLGGNGFAETVIGHRNIEQFKQLTAPHIFRATKSELNLPDKLYDEVVFSLSKEQKDLIAGIRDNYLSTLEQDADNFTRASNGAVAVLRMQQISCGFVSDSDEKTTTWLKENPRLKTLEHVIDRLGDNKVIIWCRFINDILSIQEMLGKEAVKIHGDVLPDARRAALGAFIEGDARYLVSNAKSLGRGVDGLQKACSYGLYYSNSYNSIERWQSEDRIHRLGMLTVPPTYIDLIGRGSPDRKILANLKAKKALSDWVLDDFKAIMKETTYD